MWFVYILLCRDGTLYTGATTDLNHRLARHNAGRGGEIYPGPPAGAAGLLGALPRPAGGSAPGAGHQSLAQGGKIGPLPSDGKFVNLWEDFFH